MNTIREIKLSYSKNVIENVKITDSNSAYKVLLDNWDKDTIELQEEFKVLFLNRANIVLGIYNLSKGGVSGTIVDIKLLLATAIKANASSIIIAHNHPSGNLKSSKSDIRLTKKIKAAAELLDLNLLDHIIVTKKSYNSFKENSLL